MAIRYVSFKVSEDTTVTPNVPQYAGVQGEHNATQIAFIIEVNGALAHPDYHYYIECIDAAGNYDRTKELYRYGSEISTLMPYAWTQYGGISTVRLCVETSGELLYSIEGQLQLEERGAAIEKVDGLLRTDLTETLAACRAEADACRTETEACRTEADACRAEADACRAEAETCRAIAGEVAATAGAFAQDVADAREAIDQDVADAKEELSDAIDALPRVSSDVAEDAIWSSRYMADTLCPYLNESGETVTAYPLAGYPIQVTAQHKNLITPPATAATEMNGLTFTPHADGTVTVDGTATADTTYLLVETDGADSPLATNGVPLGTSMLFYGCPAGGSESTYSLRVSATPPASSTSGVSYVRETTGAAMTFTTVEADYADTTDWQCVIHVAAGTVCDELLFSPHLLRQDELTLTVTDERVTTLTPMTAGATVIMTAHGGETTFSLEPSGVVTVTGRQDLPHFCGNLDAALDSILALQNALLGGDGV